MPRYEGKTVILTGGCGGIGGAVAERLTEEGARVVIGDIDPDIGADLVERINGRHGDVCRVVPLDVTSAGRWVEVVRETERFAGSAGLDLLVNAAGVAGRDGIEATTIETWQHVVDVNLMGTWLGMRAAAPALRSRGGAIVNVSSIWGLVGSNGSASYHASKGGVRSLSRAAAVELGKDAIRVNVVFPGLVDTPLTQTHAPGVRETMISQTVLGRMARPDEIAAAIAFLGSDDASYITGAEIAVDGGYTAR